MKCSICGKEFGEGATCNYCGTDRVTALGNYQGYATPVNHPINRTPEPLKVPGAHCGVQQEMNVCWNCGEVIPQHSIFCPFCSTKLVVACPSCGKNYSARYPACPHCGINRENYIAKKQKEEEQRRLKLEKQKMAEADAKRRREEQEEKGRKLLRAEEEKELETYKQFIKCNIINIHAFCKKNRIKKFLLFCLYFVVVALIVIISNALAAAPVAGSSGGGYVMLGIIGFVIMCHILRRREIEKGISFIKELYVSQHGYPQFITDISFRDEYLRIKRNK